MSLTAVMRRLLAIASLAWIVAAPSLAQESVRLTIIQVNDAPRAEDVAGRGGMAKLATIVKRERAAGHPVLVVHAGNAISPSLLSGFDKGAHMMELLNRVGVDVMAFGNHEFDFGAVVASGRALEAAFPVLLANVRDADGRPPQGMAPTWMADIEGFRIGFIGLARGDLREVSSPGDVAVLPPLAVAQRLAPELRSAGADLVVALGTVTEAEERALTSSGTVDLVLGSSERMHAAFDGRTAAAASSRHAEHVMLLDLGLERYEVEVAIEAELPGSPDDAAPIDAVAPEAETRFGWSLDFRSVDTLSVDADPAVADQIQSYLLHLSKELDARIGVVDADLDARDIVVRSGESPLADAVADIMRTALRADAALLNAGAFRADQVIAAGTPITRRSIVQWLPFENRVLLLRVGGEALLAALENGVSQVDSHAGRFPIVSGLQVTFDPRRPVGDRVLTVTVGGRPLSLDNTYSLAVNDFISVGGDGYGVLARARRLVDAQTSELLVKHVADAVARAGGIAGTPGQRVKATPVN